MDSLTSLTNHVVVVTGASRGIGKAIAKGFGAQGAAVAVLGRTTETVSDSTLTIEATTREIVEGGGKAIAYECDVTDSVSVSGTFEALAAELGPVDTLVNNAGVLARIGLIETSPELWDSIIRTNLHGVYFCTMAVLPSMQRLRHGTIINISSSRAYSDDAQSTAYAVSKAGLDRLTIKLATEVRDQGISVNSLQPGLTMTESMAEKNPDLLAMSPRWTEEKNIVPACIWLASQAGSALTGRILDEEEFGTSWPQ